MLGDAQGRILEDRELRAHAAREPPQHLDVERQLGDVERRWQRGHVDLHGIGLVPAQHEPAALVAHVDVGVDHACDRELGPDPGDRLGDQQLMARRHDRQRRAETRGDEARPRAGGVHHGARRNRAARRPHALHAPRTELEARGGRVREQHGAELLGRPAVAERQLGRLDVAVGRAPRDGDDVALAEDRQPLTRLGDGDEVDGDAGRAPARHLVRELFGVALGARDLQRAALGEAERLAGLAGERRKLRDRSAGEPGQRRACANLARQPGGARRGLRGEAGALEHRHVGAEPGQVIGRARAEGAGAHDDDVRRVERHGRRLYHRARTCYPGTL